MVNRKYRVVVPIVLSMGLAVQLLGGVLTGFHQKWFEMGFFFFFVGFTVYGYVGFLLNLKIDTCFEHLENLISGKSDSIRLGNQLIGNVVTILMVIFIAALTSLSILAGLRQHWFIMCVLSVALAITFFISWGVMTALKIAAFSKRMEELISKDKDDRSSKEQSGE